jgi:hypothetical protein
MVDSVYDRLVKILDTNFGYVEEELATDIAEKIKSAGLLREESEPCWIPVTERLPDSKMEVLVSSGMFSPLMEVAFWDGLFYSAWDGKTEVVAVTHWMPLPEPPKEE